MGMAKHRHVVVQFPGENPLVFEDLACSLDRRAINNNNVIVTPYSFVKTAKAKKIIFT